MHFFLKLFKRPLTPSPPRYEHVCCNFFWTTFKKVRKRLSRQNTTKSCVNLWVNVKLTLKFWQFYPQFETFLPLKKLSCQFYVAKKPFRIIIDYLQQNCWTWVWLNLTLFSLSTLTIFAKIKRSEKQNCRQKQSKGIGRRRISSEQTNRSQLSFRHLHFTAHREAIKYQ